MSVQGSPDSPKRSRTPVMVIAKGSAGVLPVATAAATIPPSAPTWCSSAVRRSPVSRAARRSASASSGLIVWRLSTRASTPSCSLRIHAARIASGTIGPQAAMVRSSPSDS